MDVATMVALNNLNMLTMMSSLAATDRRYEWINVRSVYGKRLRGRLIE